MMDQIRRSARKLAIGVSGLSSPPDKLVSQLEEIVLLRPYDTHFEIQTGAGKGYGTARCTEKGCVEAKEIIILGPDTLDDKGNSAGVGSLDALFSHQTQSKMHKESVMLRLREEATAKSLQSSSSSTSAPKIQSIPELVDMLNNLTGFNAASPSTGIELKPVPGGCLDDPMGHPEIWGCLHVPSPPSDD